MIGLRDFVHDAIVDIPLLHLILWASALCVPMRQYERASSDSITPDDVLAHRLFEASYFFCASTRIAVRIAVALLKVATMLVFARYTAQGPNRTVNCAVGLLLLLTSRMYDLALGALNGNVWRDAQMFANVGAITSLAAVLCLSYVRRSAAHPFAARVIVMAWNAVCLYACLLAVWWQTAHRLLSAQQGH